MYSTNPAFQKSIKIPHSYQNQIASQQINSTDDSKLNWEWYNPPEDSIPVTFCLDTSLHGLKYVGQRKRHICERLIWLAAFLAAVITSVILIWGMWNDYRNMPIITVFNPTEKNLDAIPFPSVTICNVNNIRKSSFDDQLATVIAKGIAHKANLVSAEEFQRSLAKFVDMNHICDSTLTFVDRFVKNATFIKWYEDIKWDIAHNSKEIEKYVNPIATLRNVSQPCNKMILHCIWLDDVRNCSDLFHSIETDYGYCCTFNTVPVSLLLKYSEDTKDKPKDVNAWKAENLDYEKLMFTEKTIERRFPLRQRYPGKLAGLSFLLDPDLKEYFCTNTDSEGFVMGINVPLDFPRMKDNAIAIKTNAEVLVGLKPEITMSDDLVKDFPLEKRRCYYGNEYKLPHYTMYTASNCMSECIARKTLEECECTRYYMPHDMKDKLCKPYQYNCTELVQKNIIKFGLSTVCSECLPTCTEIDFHKEVTLLRLRRNWKVEGLMMQQDKSSIPKDISMVHVFYNTDSVYPRLRKELTTTTQLMSNAGGLLGLCLGFSVLSLLEILYYATMRICCNFYREKTIKDKKEKSRMTMNENYPQPGYDKKRWFHQAFNGSSEISNMEKGERRIKMTGMDEGYNDHDDVFQVHNNRDNLPAHFRGSFEDQFHRAFLASFPQGGYTYPK